MHTWAGIAGRGGIKPMTWYTLGEEYWRRLLWSSPRNIDINRV
jgi:hypothetical protein